MSFDAWAMTAPKWQLRLSCGLVFGLLNLVSSMTISDETLGEALISASISGVIFGFLFGGALAWSVREQREALKLSDPAEQRAAVRAVGRGPVPEDPDVRAAALRLARRRLMQAESTRSTGAVVGVGAIVLGLAAVALWLSPWFWIGPPLVVALWGYSRWQAGHLAGRAVLLEAAA